MKQASLRTITLSLGVLLSACGGGGAPPPLPPPVDESPSLPPGVAFNDYIWRDTIRLGAPVMEFGASLHVGADVAPRAGALAPAGQHNGVALSRGQVRDGESVEDVVGWLQTQASHTYSVRDITGLTTFPQEQATTRHGEVPGITRVTIAYGPETRDRSTRFARLTQDAVRIINTALPFNRQIRFTPDVDPRPLHEIGYGEIVFYVIPKTDPYYPKDAHPSEFGRAQVTYILPDDSHVPRGGVPEGEVEGVLFSEMLIDPNAVASLTDPEVTHVLVHELMHAVGFVSHTDPARFTSILNDVGFISGTQPRALIYPLDREVLLAAYSRFARGTLPEDISVETLGPWSDTSFHLRGDLDIGAGAMAFGVAFRNGLPQPWAFGPTPATALPDNPALSGTVTWNGALVGITPLGQEVVGTSALNLDMADFLGHLDLTDLRFEGGGTWEDGDLRYAVRANQRDHTFQRADTEYTEKGEQGWIWSGKDLGTVTGAFFGRGHEGMGGVLERHDLSAAFGGKR